MISITLSKLMFKKHGLVPGEDIEARLARAEYYLKENDLDSAAREMNQLQGWPKKLASGWVDDARKRLEVKQVVKVMLDCLESLIIRCSI
jgi:mitofilin